MGGDPPAPRGRRPDPRARRAVRHRRLGPAHHERLDGHGYPARLEAAEISLEARILAVADAYEAMVADRPYRANMPPEAAREELLGCAGTQFDPDVVHAFLGALDEELVEDQALGRVGVSAGSR